MTYNIELDISSEPTHQEIIDFAKGYGCTVTLIQQNGPAGWNPLYQFHSDNFDYLEELASQVLGTNFDEEAIKTMVWET